MLQHLKGGSDIKAPLDAEATLKLNSVILLLYGAMQFPGSPIPLMDFTGKLHSTQNSLFYNDESTISDSNKGALRWVGSNMILAAAFNYMALEGDEDSQKKACKLMAINFAVNFGLIFVNKHPIACGGPILCPIFGVLNALHGF